MACGRPGTGARGTAIRRPRVSAARSSERLQCRWRGARERPCPVADIRGAERAPFAINREWDSATHPEHIYERSDHYNYARKGIPIAFFTTGLHADYHKPSDEADKIDYEKLARVARLIRDVTVVLGNSSSRPGTIGQ